MATLNGLTINDTGFINLPASTTANRTTPATGMIRYNSDKRVFEGYNGTAWVVITSLGSQSQSTDVTVFTSTPAPGTWPIPTNCNYVNALIVAGGGGGGLCMGGGGGGGGVRYITNIPVTPGGTVTVTVGAGGAGANSGRSNPGGRGGNSVFGSFTATGGGGGATWDGGNSDRHPGGSGGGACQGSTVVGVGNTPSVTPPQGFPGGAQGGSIGSYNASGGGGGAAGRGSDGTPYSGGTGGSGACYSIVPGAFGGGGGGGQNGGGAQNGSALNQGRHGGGFSTQGPDTGGAGTANTGAGGGGGGHPPDGPGGAGGSGFVAVQPLFGVPTPPGTI